MIHLYLLSHCRLARFPPMCTGTFCIYWSESPVSWLLMHLFWSSLFYYTTLHSYSYDALVMQRLRLWHWFMSRAMWFTTMWYFDTCRPTRACAATSKLRNYKWCSISSLRVIEYSSDKQILWSDCAYAQADLRLCWSHIPHCWKSRAATLISLPSSDCSSKTARSRSLSWAFT